MKYGKGISLMGLAMAMVGVGDNQVRGRKEEPRTKKPFIQNGHKPFIVYGETVYALNQHNAEKKYLKELRQKP